MSGLVEFGRRVALGILTLLVVACGLAGLGGAAHAQVTNADIVSTCSASRALPDGTWTYNSTHSGWTDVQWGVENPFPGEFSDIMVELFVTAKPTFVCLPVNAQGQNPQNLPAFGVTVNKNGKAGLGDELGCQYDGASSSWKMVLAFPGAACPWPLASGIPVNTYTAQGSYATTSGNLAGSPNCVVHHPSQLGTGVGALNGKVRHPIIMFVPGQGSTASAYPNTLAFFASHGFAVVAVNSTDAAAASPVLSCMDAMISANANSNSPFFGKLNIYNIGVMGHQEGAAGALMAGRDRFITGTVLIDPKIAGVPGFLTSSINQQWAHTWIVAGALDIEQPPASNAQVIYDQTGDAFFALDPQGDHLVTPKDSGVGVPAFAWLLSKDSLTAPRFFFPPSCTLCSNTGWTVQRKGDFLVP